VSEVEEPRFLRVALVDVALHRPTEIVVGQSLWLPVELSGSGALVTVRVTATSDNVMPLSSERVLQLPFVAQPVRACVEVLGVRPTTVPTQILIAATSDDGLAQGAAVLVSVV